MNKRADSRRGFLGKTGLTAAFALAAGRKATTAAPTRSGLNLNAMIQPIPKRAKFIDENWYIWGGSMTRTDDGTCHLLYARWPRRLGHFAWLSHSEIAHAAADSPLGPYTFQSVALPGNQGPNWVTNTTHNPTVLHARGKYFLYFSSARVKGTVPNGMPDPKADYWHPTRETQRIGVAYADRPSGPWTRVDKPLIPATPGTHDARMTSNPSVTVCPDGSFLMVYKCLGEDGRVFHGVAVADDPLGPFTKDPEPVLTHETSKFPAEYPFIWYQDSWFYGILKDMQANYTPHRRALVLFESADGHAWEPSAHPLVTTRTIRWEDGSEQQLNHLERPQLFRENGRPAVLFCAADEDRNHSFNVHIPLK